MDTDPGDRINGLSEELIDSLQDASDKIKIISGTLLSLQESITADHSIARIAMNLAKGYDDKIDGLTTKLSHAVTQYHNELTTTIPQYRQTIDSHQKAAERYRLDSEAYQALQLQESSITTFTNTLNRLSGMLLSSQGIVADQAMISRGENLNLKLEKEDLRAQIENLEEDNRMLNEEKDILEKDNKQQRALAKRRGEALRRAGISDSDPASSSTQADTRTPSWVGDLFGGDQGISKRGVIAQVTKRGWNKARTLASVPATTVARKAQQPSVAPTISPPRMTRPPPRAARAEPVPPRPSAASPVPTLGNIGPLRPSTAHSYLSGGMLSSPPRQRTPDPNLPLFEPSNPLHDPRRSLVYSPSRQGNGIGVYRSIEAAQSMPDISNKRPASKGKSPVRRTRPRRDSDVSMDDVGASVLDIARRRERTAEEVEDREEDERRVGSVPPVRQPGERSWDPPTEGNSRPNTIFAAIRKPANWTEDANQELTDTLNGIINGKKSTRRFADILHDLHGAPLCVPSRLDRLGLKEDQTEPCNLCQAKNRVCWGLKILDGTDKPKGRYTKGKSQPEMTFMRNGDGHYWEAIYRPGRGPGGDGGDGGNDGGEGGSGAGTGGIAAT